jgi:hypothetical protein
MDANTPNFVIQELNIGIHYNEGVSFYKRQFYHIPLLGRSADLCQGDKLHVTPDIVHEALNH